MAVPYRVEIKESAVTTLQGLKKDDQRRISQRIDALATSPRSPKCEPLKGDLQGLYRVRCGDYRIIYQIHDDRLIVLVLTIGHRREVYR